MTITTTRFYYPHGIEGETTETTVKEWGTVYEAIKYSRRYAKGTRFAGVQVEVDDSIIFKITSDFEEFDYRAKQQSEQTKNTEAQTPVLTVEQVAQALAENQSSVFEQFCVTYWLHVTESGKIVPAYSMADRSFCHTVPYEQYNITEPQENPQKIYDTETMDSPIFSWIANSLTQQANKWLESERG